ncbi:MAG: hypothetical protein QM767_26660 [Anaeromyxobacter sp.]
MTRRRAAAALAFAVLLAGAGGCSKWKSLVKYEPQPGPRVGEWSDVRKAVTRREQLYDGFDHRATATATYLSPAVRVARTKRLAEWQSWTDAELARALTAERAEADRYEDFVVAFYAADPRTNDLDGKQSVWRVALEVDEGEFRPAEIRALDIDATLLNLYPYIGNFDVVYRVRFPRAPGGPLGGRMAVLEIAGALGQINLDFETPAAVAPEWPLERIPDR